MPAQGSTQPIRSLQAKSAAARRWGSPNRDDVARDYAAARLADYISRVVATAPPLTVAQQDRLAKLLRSGGPDAAA